MGLVLMDCAMGTAGFPKRRPFFPARILFGSRRQESRWDSLAPQRNVGARSAL